MLNIKPISIWRTTVLQLNVLVMNVFLAAGCGPVLTSSQDRVSDGNPGSGNRCEQLPASVVRSFLELRKNSFEISPVCNDSLVHLADLQHQWLSQNEALRSLVPAHQQLPGTSGFSGKTLRDRINAVGLTKNAFHIAESIAAGADASSLWERHLASVFHRGILLAPGLTEFGLATSASENLHVFTAFIDETGAGQAVSWFPRSGTIVPVGRTLAERPEQALKGVGTGFPVSVHFPWHCEKQNGPQIKWFSLTGNGRAVAAGIFTHRSNASVRPADIFLIPERPLAAGQSYTVRARIHCGSYKFNHSWSFKTH